MIELLVIITIIILIISIVIPSLSTSRAAARKAYCASNQRGIGQLVATYVSDYGVYPPAYVFNCPFAMINRQLKHWSDLLINQCPYPPGSNPVPNWPRQQPKNSLFTCPTINLGGLPPANTPDGTSSASPGNNVESGETSNRSVSLWDRQARRMAFTLNEAICPRPYMQEIWCDAWPKQQILPEATRTYRFVRPSMITSNPILLSEWNADWRMLESSDPYDSRNNKMCMSYQTVHGFACVNTPSDTTTITVPGNGRPCLLSVINGSGGRDPYDVAFAEATTGESLRRVTPAEISQNPHSPGYDMARLNWLGRNHSGKTNFLHVDGHVENKTIEETITTFEWGNEFYSLNPGNKSVK